MKEARSEAAPTWEQAPVTLWRILCLAGASVFFVPTSFFVPAWFGAEPSWRLTLNKALAEGWAFGDRIVWTYGPLGVLETRYPYGLNPWLYAGFDLFVFVLFLGLAWDVLRLNLDRALAWGAFATLFTCKRIIHDQPSGAVYCLLIYLLVRTLRRPGVLSSVGLTAASVLMLFFKMNFGLVGFFLCAIVLGVKVAAREKSAFLWLALLLVQTGLAWAVAVRLHTNLIAYIRSSLALVSQYSDGMAWGPGPGGVAHWVVCALFWGYAVLALCYFLGVGVGSKTPHPGPLPSEGRGEGPHPGAFSSEGRGDWRRNGVGNEPLLYLFIAGAVGFVLYKTAIVRSDYNHNKAFLLGFPILALIFITHGPESLRRFWRGLFFVSTAYASLLMAAEFGNCLIYMRSEYLKVFFPINYFHGIKEYPAQASWTAYQSFAQSAAPERTSPPNVREFVGTNSVDVYPFEATLALSSGLNFQPLPIPQSYATIGKELEARNVAFLESSQAPRFIFYVLGEKGYSIDGRYPLWEEPAVKRLLQRDYTARLAFNSLQGAQPETEPKISPVLVLERIAPGKAQKAVTVATHLEKAGQEFTLPVQEDELYASIRIKKTLLGRLVSFFYRGATATVHFRLANGSEKEMRFIPANLETGVLVNFFADPSEPQALSNYLNRQSRKNPKCLRLRIDFEHPWEYRREFETSYFRDQSP